MGLFQTLANVAKGFIGVGSDTGGYSLIPSLIETGTSLVGTALGLRANKNATERYMEAQRLRDQAIREGNQEALRILEEIMAETQPAVAGLRRIAAEDPRTLRPAQQTALADARRITANRLATTGLRGSGRAEVAAVRDVEGRLKGDMIESNLARQERSLSQLASPYFQAQTGRANIAAGQGPQIAGLYGETGEAGQRQELAKGHLYGQAIKDIGSVIAEAQKRRERERMPSGVV